MLIPVGLIITSVISFTGVKAIPAWWHNHVELQHVKEARHLCDEKNDCDAYKTLILKGYVSPNDSNNK